MTQRTTDTATRAADVVALYRDGMEQVLVQLRPMSASVFEQADFMEHPTEDGSVITDHIVVTPAEIEFPMRVSAEDIPAVIDEARALMEGAELLTVQTRGGAYFNMAITALPHEERPEEIDAPTVLLRLKQVRIVTPEYGSIQQSQARTPAQASTVRRGQQQTRSTTTTPAQQNTQERGSTLYRLFGRGRG